MKLKNIILIILTTLYIIGAFFALDYGLPFHLVGDEESIIGGTLQFLNERTLLPVLNPEAFTLLYYPIALPYSILALVVPYSLIVLLFNPVVTNTVELGHYLLVNLDHVWLLARSVTLFMGLAAVFVINKLAKVVFPKQQLVGFFATLFILTSFFHFQLSIVMRHWMFSTVFLMLALYFLFKSNFSNRKDAIWAGVCVGLASGFGQIGLVTAFFVGLSYIVLAHQEPWFGLKNKNIWWFSMLALGGFVFFVATHPGGFIDVAEGVEISTKGFKPLGFYLSEFKQTIIYLFRHETIISSLGFLGALVMVFKKHTNKALLFLSIIILHNIFLFIFFHNAPRYQWFIIPLFIIMAAYLLAVFWSYMNKSRLRRSLAAMIISIIYIVPGLLLVQYGSLLAGQTSEQAALAWLTEQASDEIILMHSRSITPLQQDKYVNLQEKLGRAMRRDHLLSGVEVEVYNGQKFAYTNTYFWDKLNQTPDKIQEFIYEHDPSYILFSYDTQEEYENIRLWYPDISNYTLAYQTEFSETMTAKSMSDNFGFLNKDLLTTSQLGQHIRIYKK